MANTSLKSLANFEGVTSGSFKDVISKCVAPPQSPNNLSSWAGHGAKTLNVTNGNLIYDGHTIGFFSQGQISGYGNCIILNVQSGWPFSYYPTISGTGVKRTSSNSITLSYYSDLKQYLYPFTGVYYIRLENLKFNNTNLNRHVTFPNSIEI